MTSGVAGWPDKGGLVQAGGSTVAMQHRLPAIPFDLHSMQRIARFAGEIHAAGWWRGLSVAARLSNHFDQQLEHLKIKV